MRVWRAWPEAGRPHPGWISFYALKRAGPLELTIPHQLKYEQHADQLLSVSLEQTSDSHPIFDCRVSDFCHGDTFYFSVKLLFEMNFQSLVVMILRTLCIAQSSSPLSRIRSFFKVIIW